jgi:hypothetical protein
LINCQTRGGDSGSSCGSTPSDAAFHGARPSRTLRAHRGTG